MTAFAFSALSGSVSLNLMLLGWSVPGSFSIGRSWSCHSCHYCSHLTSNMARLWTRQLAASSISPLQPPPRYTILVCCRKLWWLYPIETPLRPGGCRSFRLTIAGQRDVRSTDENRQKLALQHGWTMWALVRCGVVQVATPAKHTLTQLGIGHTPLHHQKQQL